MTRRSMFWRMVMSSIIRRRSRVLIAVLAVAIGATTLSGLVTIAVDVPQQMAREVRSYGANMIVTPVEGAASLDGHDLDAVTDMIPGDVLVGTAAFQYQTVLLNDQPYVAAGVDLADVQQVNPYWYIDGQWPSSDGQLLVGEEIADTVGAEVGDRLTITLLDEAASARAGASSANEAELAQSAGSQTTVAPASSQARTIDLTVAGILKTGSNEDGYLYMSAADMALLTGHDQAPTVAEYSVAVESERLAGIIDSVNAAGLDAQAQAVQRLTQSDSGILDMLRSLLAVITVIVLALTMIGVSTTMVAVVAERRNEIGLRKALGATSRSVVGEFMGESVLLGLIGGLIGAGLGHGFAALVSLNVFHRAGGLHPLILAATVIAAVAVSVIACLPPVRRAAAVDPALVLRGE